MCSGGMKTQPNPCFVYISVSEKQSLPDTDDIDCPMCLAILLWQYYKVPILINTYLI